MALVIGSFDVRLRSSDFDENFRNAKLFHPTKVNLSPFDFNQNIRDVRILQLAERRTISFQKHDHSHSILMNVTEK